MQDACRRLQRVVTVQHSSTAIQALMRDATRPRSCFSFLTPRTKRTNHAQFKRCETNHATKKTHKPAFSPRGRPMMRDAMSPSERNLCNQRCVVDSGQPSASVIFWLPRPRVESWKHQRQIGQNSVEETICGGRNRRVPQVHLKGGEAHQRAGHRVRRNKFLWWRLRRDWWTNNLDAPRPPTCSRGHK